MSLKALYQETIKKHNLSPIGADIAFAHTHSAEGYNPSCGDELDLYFKLTTAGKIEKIGFQADACAICKASASMLCEHSHGKSVDSLREDAKHISAAMHTQSDIKIASLNALAGVSAHKTRINCALLPWQTLINALDSAPCEQ